MRPNGLGFTCAVKRDGVRCKRLLTSRPVLSTIATSGVHHQRRVFVLSAI